MTARCLVFLVLSLVAVRGVAGEEADLRATIAALDRVVFDAGYNRCDIEALAGVVAEDFEFYHDVHGATLTKAAFVEGFRNGICGLDYTPRRELVEGSLQVFPLYRNGELYGAIQQGAHRFYARRDGEVEWLTASARFTTLWLLEQGEWKMARAYSYDHATPAQALQATVAAAVPGFLAEHDVPAAGIAYIADGSVQWVHVRGEQAPGVAASDATMFNIASLAKPVTAEVALRMASAGELALDEPLSAFWVDPDVADDPRHAKLTPRLVLQHRTGLPNWRSDTGGVLAFRADPGTTTGYSGEGYNYLARFLEEKTGAAFTDLASQWVFAPQGMQASTFSPGDEQRPSLAQSKGPDSKWSKADVSTPWNAADNLYASVGDYARFVLGVMRNEGMSEAIAAERFRIVDDQMRHGCPMPAEHCPRAVGHGLGWEILDYGSERVIRHSGQDRGENTLAYFVPERGIGVVILTNGANGRKVIRDVSALLYDAPAFNALLRLQAE